MSKKNSKSEKRGVGRPKSKVVWPNGRFTREQAYAANPGVCKLTVINHLNADMKGNKSILIRMKDEHGEPQSKAGKGRKPFIYLRRAQYEAGKKSIARLQAAKKSKVSVDIAPATAEPVTA